MKLKQKILQLLSRMFEPRIDAVAQILVRYAAGERSFAGLDLDDKTYNFDGLNLEGANFSTSFIVGTFRGANLTRANFSNTNVKTCDFRGANLRGATFEGAAIDAAEFEGADLDGALFAGATEQGYVYSSAELPIRISAHTI